MGDLAGDWFGVEVKPATLAAANSGPGTQGIGWILERWSLFGRDWSMVNRSGPVRSAGRAHGCGEPMALLEALSGDMNERR